jgi:hypothetical protein
VAAGQWSWAARNAAPDVAHPETEVAGQAAITHGTVSVSISVSEDGVNFSAGSGDLKPVAVKARKPLVVRFEVKNISGKEMAIPTGRAKELKILLGVEGWVFPRDITTFGDWVIDEPLTAKEEKVVKVAPGGTYRFDYWVPAGVTKLAQGRNYRIHGTYFLIDSQSITLEVK